MKKLFLLIALCLPSTVFGQGTQITKARAQDLPNATSPSVKNSLFMVIDGTSISDCTVGGGTTSVLCQSNGTVWIPIPGSGGAAATAGALDHTPTTCTAQAATGIAANGNAVGCFTPASTAAGSPPQTQVNDPGNPGHFGGTACETFPNLSTGPANIACDWHSKGPNPYVDITQYGARASNPNVIPVNTGITATCTATSTSVTISNASTFINGDGVVVYGCGPAHSMTTPSAPTVAPAIALSGTGTGITSTTVPTGATTRCYVIVAADRGGGLTAASTETCTTTGNALGFQGVNITSASRSNSSMTFTTSAAHGFNAGCNVNSCGEVYIDGSNSLSDPSFYGWYRVSSVADSTHFTLISFPDTRQNATSSATGGRANWFSCDHITWTAVTGAIRYYIYEGNSGSETLVGVSAIEGTTNTDFTFDYFGSTMMGNFQAPPYVPNTPPSGATSDNLSTTIASGGTTTSLTLANAAGTTCPSAACPATVSIRLDIAPAVLAAITAINANGGQGTLYIPAAPTTTTFTLNSYLNTTGLQYAVSQSGVLYLNETWEYGPPTGGVKWYGDRIPQGGGVGADAWQTLSVIDVNTANPGIYGSTGFGTLFKGVYFFNISSGNNNARLLLLEAGFNMSFLDSYFQTGQNNNDQQGIGLYLRGSAGQGASNVIIDRVTFQAGGGGTTVSHAPVWFCIACGKTFVRSAYFLHRGAVLSATNFTNQFTYINGGGTPLYTYTNFNSTAGWTVSIGDTVLDTFSHPCVALFTNQVGTVDFPTGICTPSAVGAIGFAPGITGGRNVIRSGAALLTGGTTAAGASAAPNRDSIGLQYNPNGAYDGIFQRNDGPYTTQIFNAAVGMGNNYPAFVNGATPTAPTCAVQAGGSLTNTTTFTFAIVPVWQNGGEGVFSQASTGCTTSTGNQQIQINWTIPPGNPKGVRLYYATSGFPANEDSNFTDPFPVTTTSFTWSAVGSLIKLNPATTVPTGGPTMMMPGVQGIAAPVITVANGLKTGNAAPTCSSTGLGGGSCGTFLSGSDDISGGFSFTAGAAAAATGTLTLTFNVASPGTTYCLFNLSNQNTGWQATATIFPINGSSTNQAVWTNAATALTNTLLYTIFYHCDRH